MAARSNKILYALICGIMLLILMGFVLYKNQNKTISVEKGTYSFITSNGKKIEVTLRESSTSSKALISTEGFQINELITIEKEKLSNVFFTDLNGDTSEEVILIFTPLSAESNGSVAVFTTYFDSELTPVELLEISESDKAPGGLFEGYAGGDSFIVQENILFRNFLTEETQGSIPPTQEQEVQAGQEGALNEDNNLSLPLPEQELPPLIEKKQKQVSYILTSSEGLFFLEPKELEQARIFTASSTATLANTTWRWLSLNYGGNVTSQEDGGLIIFSFNDNNTFTASSSCGYFTGSYVLNGYLMRLGSIITDSASLGMSCSEENNLLKETLPLSESFVISENQLMISLAENKGVILFVKQ